VSQRKGKKEDVEKLGGLCKVKKRLSCPVRALAGFPRVCVDSDWPIPRSSDIGKAASSKPHDTDVKQS